MDDKNRMLFNALFFIPSYVEALLLPEPCASISLCGVDPHESLDIPLGLLGRLPLAGSAISVIFRSHNAQYTLYHLTLLFVLCNTAVKLTREVEE